MRITENFLRSLKPTGERQIMYRDNLEIRVSAKGKIAIDFRYKTGDKVHRTGLIRMANYRAPIPSLTEVRHKYAQLLGFASHRYPLDTALQRIVDREAAENDALAARPKMVDAINEYIKIFQQEKASWRSEARYMLLIANAIGPKHCEDVTKGDLQRIIDQHRTKTPTQARHLGKAISRLFGFMARRDYIPSREVARDLDKPAQRVRTRLINDEELAELLGPDCHPMLIATAYNPLRRSEMCRLHWDNIENVDGDIWVTVQIKNNKLFRTYLTPQFMAQVKTTEGFLFRGRHGEANGKPMVPNSLSELMKEHTKAVGVKDATLHDFRTVIQSWAEGNNLTDTVNTGVLAHARQGMLRHYGHSDMAVAKKKALDLWASHLDKIRGVK